MCGWKTDGESPKMMCMRKQTSLCEGKNLYRPQSSKKNGEPTPAHVRITTKISRLLVKRTLHVRMDQTPKQWRNGKSGKSGENGMSLLYPNDVKRKNPLVKWPRGQGLTVLPQPPPLSNSYLNQQQQGSKEVE